MSIPFWRSRGATDAQPAAASGGASPEVHEIRYSPLQGRFVERLRTEYPLLVQRRDNGIESNTESARLVHRMAGSAGMVGFAEISEAAGKLDDAIQDGDGNTRNLLCDLLAILGKTLAAQPTH